MHSLFITPSLVVELFLTLILFVLFSITFIATLPFLKEIETPTSLTYKLEKRSHLIASLLSLALFFKVLLLPFFIYNLDMLSSFIPGAMCSAGVVSSNVYGGVLIGLKLFVVFTLMLYGVYYKESQRVKALYHSKRRHFLFVGLYLFLVLEIVLEYLFYTNIPYNETVSCCSTLYKAESMQTIATPYLISGFYLLYGVIILANWRKKREVVALLSVSYIYISYESITYFFSSYIYELPTHKCPYCLLQGDYHYVGYFIYTSLFLATFYSFVQLLFTERDESKKVLFFYTFFVLFLSYYFLSYLIKNGTFLW
jgi:hypothetical protein